MVHLRHLLDAVDDGVALFRRGDRRVVHANARFREWFGELAEGDELPASVAALLDVAMANAEAARGSGKPAARPVQHAIPLGPRRTLPLELVVRDADDPALAILYARNVAKLHEKDALLKSFSGVIDENNRILRRQKRELAELLDNMRQAVLVFDATLVVTQPPSAYAAVVFGGPIEGQSVMDTVFRAFSPASDETAMMQTAFAFAFGNDELQWELNSDKLPTRFSYRAADGAEPRLLRAVYTPLYDDAGDVERIMMVVEDVTVLDGLERALADARAASSTRLAIIDEVFEREPDALEEHLRALRTHVRSLGQAIEERTTSGRAAVEAILRTLHTMKGNARAVRFRVLADVVHRAEDAVRQALERTDREQVETAIAEVVACASSYEEISARIRGGGDATATDRISVERNLVEELASAMRVRFPASDPLVRAMDRLLEVPLERMEGELRSMVRELGAELSKTASLKVDGRGVRLPEARYALVHDCLVHLLRNALDHGVETPAEREARGKDEIAEIVIRCHHDGLGTRLSVSDDGGGIDVERVLGRAVALGLIAEDEARRLGPEDAYPLLLRPGFTTRTTVTDVSGRGVGLDFVRATVEEAGGELTITSERGHGTTIELLLPITPPHARAA